MDLVAAIGAFVGIYVVVALLLRWLATDRKPGGTNIDSFPGFG